jgi:ADP-ribose pyrophosphatase YjhB (NUDIX family)
MKITYCIECGNPYTKVDDTHYRCPQGHDFWNNPHAAVAVVIQNDKGEVLFSKRGIEPKKGMYDLPGGFCEYKEAPLSAAKREIAEETGLLIDNLEVIATFASEYQPNDSVCDIVVLARTHTGTPKPNDDSAALEWYSPEFLDGPEFYNDYSGLSSIIKKL